jgi:adenylate kinase
MPQTRPNILVSGTPGTGKSTLCEALAKRLELDYINIGKLVKDEGFHAGFDTEFQAFKIDESSEDQIIDYLEPLIAKGGLIVEHLQVDFFPERFFDLVLILRSDNTILFDRLTSRGYSSAKREENLTAEIMNVIYESACESYDEEIVQELQSNTIDDLEDNVERVSTWYQHWMSTHNAAS